MISGGPFRFMLKIFLDRLPSTSAGFVKFETVNMISASSVYHHLEESLFVNLLPFPIPIPENQWVGNGPKVYS